MNSYLVCWEIDIEAGSTYDAAKEALFIMQNKDSEALFFKVIESSTGHMTDVDLFGWEEEESEMYGKIK
jgi:hypothetical protein